MKQIISSIVLMCLASCAIIAQPSIIYTVDGDRIFAREIDNFKDSTLGEIVYLNMRSRWQTIERQEIFSINLANETVHYLYQPIFEGDRSLQEMKSYVEGTQFGNQRSVREQISPFLIGFAGGITAMALPPDRLFLAPIAALGTVITIGIRSPWTTPDGYDEHFIEGYRNRRKKMNIKSSIYGSLAGLATGVAGSYLIYGWGIK